MEEELGVGQDIGTGVSVFISRTLVNPGHGLATHASTIDDHLLLEALPRGLACADERWSLILNFCQELAALPSLKVVTVIENAPYLVAVDIL